MTIEQLQQTLSLTVFCPADLHRPVSGGFCGDLLSWVLSHATPGTAWLTIMSHETVAAVAARAQLPCVILTEGVRPDPRLVQTAAAHGITLLGTELPTFACAARLSDALAALR